MNSTYPSLGYRIKIWIIRPPRTILVVYVVWVKVVSNCGIFSGSVIKIFENWKQAGSVDSLMPLWSLDATHNSRRCVRFRLDCTPSIVCTKNGQDVICLYTVAGFDHGRSGSNFWKTISVGLSLSRLRTPLIPGTTYLLLYTTLIQSCTWDELFTDMKVNEVKRKKTLFCFFILFYNRKEKNCFTPF